MSMLHIVNKSALDRNSLETCVNHTVKGATILMIEDAVYSAVKNMASTSLVEGAMKDVSVAVLGPDLKARGISEDKLIDGVTVVDYAGFVELTTKNDSVQSWL